MAKLAKLFIILILMVVLVIGGIWIWMQFSSTSGRNPMSFVPADAIYIVETKNLTDAWNEVTGSRMWEHLSRQSVMNSYNARIAYMDTLLRNTPGIDYLLKDRPMLLSAHLTTYNDYDFIIIIDLQKASKLSFLTGLLPQPEGYIKSSIRRQNRDIIEYADKQTNSKIFITTIDNLLVITFVKELMEKCLDEKPQNWMTDQKFTGILKKVRFKNLFNLYLNYSYMDDFIELFLKESPEVLAHVSTILNKSAFELDFRNEELKMNGYTTLNDIPSYIRTLSYVEPGKPLAYQIVSDNVASYVSVCFANFDDLIGKFLNDYESKNKKDFDEYKSNIEWIEKYFKVNIKDDVFSWIGNEIALIKPGPAEKTRFEDVVIAIHTKDIDAAKKGMNHLTTQIRKRSPLKFSVVDYKNFQINLLDRKHMFKLFFGKWFNQLEKPYFTYIDNFVVFSNSVLSLENIIDDYLSNHILSKNPEFINFFDNFEKETNVMVFIQTPKIYSALYYYGNEKDKQKIKENKDMLLSVSRLGLSLTSNQGTFLSRLITTHDKNLLNKDIVDELEHSVSDVTKEINTNWFEGLEFKVKPSDKDLEKEGFIQIYKDDTLIVAEGKVVDGKLQDVWKTYYPKGNLQSVVNYKDGMVNGEAFFYFDSTDLIKQAEMTFENDKITDLYKEFYPNGTIKSTIGYKDGIKHGEAKYFFNNGLLKVEGKFKKGKEKGTWKYYNEKGEVIDKKKSNED